MCFYRTLAIIMVLFVSIQADALTYGDPRVYVCPIGAEKFELKLDGLAVSCLCLSDWRREI